MRKIIEAGLKREVQLQSKLQTPPDVVSSNEFQRSVLSIIEECSPCSEPKLFITAVARELPRDGGESLADLRDRLVQCAQDLKAHGLIEINEDDYVFVPTTSPDQPDIIDRMGKRPEESKRQQVEFEEVEEHKETGPLKAKTEDRTVSVPEPTEEPAESGSTVSAEDEDADVLDLTSELDGAPESEKEEDASLVLDTSLEPAKEDASFTEAEDEDLNVEPVATSWMKPKGFMNLLAKSRK